MNENTDALRELTRQIKRIAKSLIEKAYFDKTYTGTIVAVNSDGYTVFAKGNSKFDIKTTATDLYKKGDIVKFCEPQNRFDKRYFVVDLDGMKRYVDKRIAELRTELQKG